MLPKLVIFDCDGVLVDSEIIANDVIVRSLAHYGLTISAEVCMDLFVGTSDAYVKTTAEQMGAQLPDNWLAEIDTETYARLKQGVPIVAGVVDIIDRLDTLDVPYCVASNGSEDKMAITLGQNGLLERFQSAMFSAHTLGISKPDPELFLHAASIFKVNPQDCIVIEDSPSGVIAARRARMKCYGYAPHNDGQKLAKEGAEVFHTMVNIPVFWEFKAYRS